MIKEELAGEDI